MKFSWNDFHKLKFKSRVLRQKKKNRYNENKRERYSTLNSGGIPNEIKASREKKLALLKSYIRKKIEKVKNNKFSTQSNFCTKKEKKKKFFK